MAKGERNWCDEVDKDQNISREVSPFANLSCTKRFVLGPNLYLQPLFDMFLLIHPESTWYMNHQPERSGREKKEREGRLRLCSGHIVFFMY